MSAKVINVRPRDPRGLARQWQELLADADKIKKHSEQMVKKWQVQSA